MSDYQLGDSVLVYQGPLLYDAKILKIYSPQTGKVSYMDAKKNELVEGEPDAKLKKADRGAKAYHVHYQGWNNKWNEWVSEARVVDRTTENLLLQKNLKLRQMQPVKREEEEEAALKVKTAAESSGHGSTSNGRKRRARSTPGGSTPGGSTPAPGLPAVFTLKRRKEFEVAVPEEVKVLLMKDWQRVTKQELLVVTPQNYTVSKVLREFSKVVCKEAGDDDEKLDNYLETIESLRTYFNRSVGTLLLYRYEREQYKDTIRKYDRLEFADLYHPIFLLRLMTIFPNLMTQAQMDLDTIRLVRGFIERFYRWYRDNENRLAPEYENCMPLVPFMQ